MNRICITTDDDGQQMDDEDMAEYEVEEVLGHIRTEKGFWFLLRFKDYAQTTWEHESLVSAPSKVQEYFARVCANP